MEGSIELVVEGRFARTHGGSGAALGIRLEELRPAEVGDGGTDEVTGVGESGLKPGVWSGGGDKRANQTRGKQAGHGV